MKLILSPSSGGGAGTPGGSDTQLQYNNAGAFGGISGATTNGTVVTLTSPNITTSILPTTNDGAPLGSTSKQFSDLFLAEGGVINWDNGDVTVTQTGNVLAFAGAATGYTFDAPIVANSTLKVLESTGATYYSIFQGGNQSADITYTLPTTVGGAGTYLKDVAGDGVLSWATPAGSGDVVKVGTPVDNQVGVWTGDGTIEGTAGLVFDSTTNRLKLGTMGTVGSIELPDAGGGSLVLSAPTGATIFTFPAGGGTAGYVLETNGSGATSWVARSIAIGGAISSGTAGSILFVDVSGNLGQDNANFFWDDTNNRLGIGNSSPTVTLDVTGAGLFSSTLAASNLSGTNTGDQDLSGYALLSGATFTGTVTTPGTTSNTYKWDAATTASGLAGSAPTFTNYYGGDTNALGDPTGWILVNVNGTDRKIPFYA